MRRSMMGRKKLQLFTKRFYPAGNYTWIVPKGCREVDVFLVGGGGAGHNGSGGGGGYTKTFKKDTSGWRDGDAISVAPGQSIPITVGKGGIGGYSEVAPNGGYSQFLIQVIELMAEMVRVMVIQAEVMPEHILVATAEVAEQEMIQIRLKRVLMDLTE